MNESYRHRIDALEQVWAVWARLGGRLTEPEWTRPTRCPGWDVAAVYAHVSMFPAALNAPPPVGRSTGQPATAADVLRGFNAPGGVAHTLAATVADTAVDAAARLDRSQLVERFTVAAPAAVAALRAVEASTRVPWPATDAEITLTEAARIMLLESTVHLLDVQRALDEPPDVPDGALGETVQLLAELTPAAEFIEAATGRASRYPSPVLR